MFKNTIFVAVNNRAKYIHIYIHIRISLKKKF